MKKAEKPVKDNRVCVMNVDDILFYDPEELYEYSGKDSAILMAEPTPVWENPNFKRIPCSVRTINTTRLLC